MYSLEFPDNYANSINQIAKQYVEHGKLDVTRAKGLVYDLSNYNHQYSHRTLVHIVEDSINNTLYQKYLTGTNNLQPVNLDAVRAYIDFVSAWEDLGKM